MHLFTCLVVSECFPRAELSAADLGIVFTGGEPSPGNDEERLLRRLRIRLLRIRLLRCLRLLRFTLLRFRLRRDEEPRSR